MSSQGSNVVGAIVAILIIGAVGVLGYYQFEVAPGLNVSTTTTSSVPSVTCPSAACVPVTINSGAGVPPTGYTQGQKTTFGYSPDVVTVVIGKNNTVFWTNGDAAPHTVTSDTAGIFDSGTTGPLTSQGGTYQFTFTAPGTYTYHCSFHPWMQGTVIVKAGSGVTSSSTGSSSASSSSSSSVATSPVTAAVTIVPGANTTYPGYTSGSTTLYGYSPLTITVMIGVNNTVTWTNKDSAYHSVVAASSDPASFDSGCLNGVGAPCPTTSSGSTFTFTFTVPGTYVYHCIYHPWMMGKVIVLAATGSTSTTSSSA